MFNLSFLYERQSAELEAAAASGGGSGGGGGGGDNDTTTNADVSGRGDIWMVSDQAIQFVYTFNLAILCGFFSLFGIVTNVINVLVFLRLGFQETINISLFGLAVSDTLSLVSLLFVSVCYNPFFMYSDLPVFTIELQHYPGGWTHVIFTRVTGFITAFITLERCLCIAFPLKVKGIMTRPRVTGVIVAIYVFTIGTMVQDYFVCYIDWKWVLSLNRTMLALTYTENRHIIELVSQYIQMVYPSLSFACVVVCTVIFVWKLSRRGKWLQEASGTGKQEKNTSARDQQVIKLVVCVAVIFIVCYLPSLLLFTAMANMQEMNMGRKYQNFFILVYSIAFPMEAINSSVNIFVYYKMMSKYKTILHSLCQKVQKRALTQPNDVPLN